MATEMQMYCVAWEDIKAVSTIGDDTSNVTPRKPTRYGSTKFVAIPARKRASASAKCGMNGDETTAIMTKTWASGVTSKRVEHLSATAIYARIAMFDDVRIDPG